MAAACSADGAPRGRHTDAEIPGSYGHAKKAAFVQSNGTSGGLDTGAYQRTARADLDHETQDHRTHDHRTQDVRTQGHGTQDRRTQDREIPGL